jgi:hypothetical protein
MSTYISFRVAQDHNMAADRDTTLLTPTSTRLEDPAATTRRCSHSLLSLAVVSVLISLIMNVELVLLLLVINYIVNLMMCVILVLCVIFVLYSLPVLEAPCTGRQPK